MEQFQSLLSYWVLLVMMLGSRYLSEWMNFSNFLKHRLCIVWGFIWALVEPVYLCLIFFWHILHVQNLCEWWERQIPLFDLVSLVFLLYYLFCKERNIKFEQKYLFTPDFNRSELRKTNGIYHRWVKWFSPKSQVSLV